MELSAMAATVMQQSQSREDFAVPGTKMKLEVPDRELLVQQERNSSLLGGMLERFKKTEVHIGPARGPFTLSLESEEKGMLHLPVQDQCHQQIAERTGIRSTYYNKMRKANAHELLATNVNFWLQNGEGRGEHMVRTLSGQARALLSTSYRVIDNIDIIEPILAIIKQHDLEVKTCNVSETKLHITALSNRLRGEVDIGDEVQAGITITNSEVGFGAFKIIEFVYVLKCLNGMVGRDVLKQTHLGKDVEIGDGYQQYIKSHTQELKDAALFSSAKDLVEGTLSQAHWDDRLNQMRQANARDIDGDLDKVCERTAKKLDLRESEAGDLLKHLAQGGQLNQWGLANAVTSLAHGVKKDGEETISYDRNMELQRKGGELLELTLKQWEDIAA
jgi:hypothetical protein